MPCTTGGPSNAALRYEAFGVYSGLLLGEAVFFSEEPNTRLPE
jgi:hypothetical protein